MVIQVWWCPFFYRLRGKKLLLEHLTDPWPFNNRFWTNTAFRGGENTDQQDLSTAVLNCKYLGWVNQKTQHGGEMPPWSPGSRMGLAPACCFISSARAPDPMGTWRSLQREGAGMPQAENPRCCKNKRGDVAPSVCRPLAQAVLVVLHPPPAWQRERGKPHLHPSRMQQPPGSRASPCLPHRGCAGKPPLLFFCLAGSSCSWFLSAPVISSLWPLQSFGKGRSKDAGFIYLGG